MVVGSVEKKVETHAYRNKFVTTEQTYCRFESLEEASRQKKSLHLEIIPAI